jgi:prepilin-type processing-associated H-X9-DG protein
MVTTYFPPNAATSSSVPNFMGADATDATSLHPGGVNFAFCDGSVHFIKNSISSWAFSTATAAGFYGVSLPNGVTYANYIFSGTLGVTQQGVYQSLSTRAGGEVVSSDQY